MAFTHSTANALLNLEAVLLIEAWEFWHACVVQCVNTPIDEYFRLAPGLGANDQLNLWSVAPRAIPCAPLGPCPP